MAKSHGNKFSAPFYLRATTCVVNCKIIQADPRVGLQGLMFFEVIHSFCSMIWFFKQWMHYFLLGQYKPTSKALLTRNTKKRLNLICCHQDDLSLVKIKRNQINDTYRNIIVVKLPTESHDCNMNLSSLKPKIN